MNTDEFVDEVYWWNLRDEISWWSLVMKLNGAWWNLADEFYWWSFVMKFCDEI